jgi:hypothetical protein
MERSYKLGGMVMAEVMAGAIAVAEVITMAGVEAVTMVGCD